MSTTGNLVMNGPGTLTITNTVTFGGLDSNSNPLGILQVHQGTLNLTGGAITNTNEIDVGDAPSHTGTLN